MGFWPCAQDPFVKLVRDKYGATVVRSPRTGIDPCDVIARQGDRVSFWGELAPLVAGGPLALPPVRNEFVSSLKGKGSATVDVGTGVSLTSKFFQAIGIPVPEAELQLQLWKGAREFSFELRDVRRKEVSVTALGAHLEGRRISRTSPAAVTFFEAGGAEMLVITHTYVTSEFAVTATNSSGAGLELSASAIEDLVGSLKGKVEVSRELSSTLAFKGRSAVTFAFGAVPCRLATDGSITKLDLQVDDLVQLRAPDVPFDEHSRDYGALFDVPGLLDFDD